MKRTVPHQHRILAERSWARGGPSPGEDVSRGRLGCPTCPRVGDPRADTRPPPYSTVERRPESRPLKATARADRRPVKGAEATSDVVRGCPPTGSPNGPKKQVAPEQNTGEAPRRTRPRREPGDAAGRRRAAETATKNK